MTAYRSVALRALLAAYLCVTGVACGASPSPPGPTTDRDRRLAVLPDRLDARRWLAAAARKAAVLGAGPLEPLGAAAGTEGDRVGGFVELAATDCMVALARPAAGISDTDLFVFNDGGDLVASDEAPASQAVVVVCPPHPGRMYVAARVMSGAGIVAVGAMRVGPEAAPAVAKALGARGLGSADSGRLAAWPGLERKIRQRRQLLGSQWEDVRRVVLPVEPSAASVMSVPVQPGRCLDVLATPGEGVHAIELVATDAAGRIVARGKPPDRDQTLVLCSEHRRTVTLSVRPRASAGLVAMVVSQSTHGAAQPLSDRVWIAGIGPIAKMADSVARHRASTRRLGMGAPRRLVSGTARVGAPKATTVRLEAGCTRLDVIGGAPLGAMAAELWADDGQLLSRARGGESATLFCCGPRGTANLEVAAELSPGPFVVEARHDAKPPQPLLSLPRAAARLLQHLEATEGPVSVRRAAGVEVVALDSAAATRRVLPVAAGSCAHLVVALDGPEQGVMLRLVDPASGLVTLRRGSGVAVGRLCARDVPRSVRAEITMARGRASALLLQWVEP